MSLTGLPSPRSRAAVLTADAPLPAATPIAVTEQADSPPVTPTLAILVPPTESPPATVRPLATEEPTDVVPTATLVPLGVPLVDLVLVTFDVRSPDEAVTPGGTASYRFTVTNTGDIQVHVALTAVTDRPDWTSTICDAAGQCTTQWALALSPGEMVEGMLRVVAPDSALLGDEARTSLVVIELPLARPGG